MGVWKKPGNRIVAAHPEDNVSISGTPREPRALRGLEECSIFLRPSECELSVFYAMTLQRTMDPEPALNRAEDSPPSPDVFDQTALGSNLRCSRHRARYDVDGDAMGCVEVGVSAAVGSTLV